MPTRTSRHSTPSTDTRLHLRPCLAAIERARLPAANGAATPAAPFASAPFSRHVSRHVEARPNPGYFDELLRMAPRNPPHQHRCRTKRLRFACCAVVTNACTARPRTAYEATTRTFARPRQSHARPTNNRDEIDTFRHSTSATLQPANACAPPLRPRSLQMASLIVTTQPTAACNRAHVQATLPPLAPVAGAIAGRSRRSIDRGCRWRAQRDPQAARQPDFATEFGMRRSTGQ